MFTDAVEALYESSAKFRQEVEITGTKAIGHVTYHPTDWSKTSKAEERDFLGGFDPNKTCPTCYMVLAKNGACTGGCE